MASVEALQSDPNVDFVLVQEGLPRAAGSERAEHYISLVDGYAATSAKKPIAFITPISHGQTDYSRALRAKAPHVSFLQEATKALRAIASVARRGERERLARGAAAQRPPPTTAARRSIIERLRAGATTEPTAFDEAQSKDVLRAYGIATPAETLVTSRADALEAAERIGYPVVLKAVSPELPHKSDIGAVALGLAAPAELAAGYDRMAKNLEQHRITGMLVARHVGGGLELVLGLHRDPEMGLVAMAGSGGVLLELVKDVTFCAPPVSPDKARDMLGRMRGARLLEGYRGTPACDVDAVVDALVALGSLAVDLGDVLQSVDINPFLALPRGGLALDALIVLQRH
jgi:acetyltransferase